MSCFDTVYQTECIKEMADNICNAYIKDDEYTMAWCIDQLQEHLDHIKDSLGRQND